MTYYHRVLPETEGSRGFPVLEEVCPNIAGSPLEPLPDLWIKVTIWVVSTISFKYPLLLANNHFIYHGVRTNETAGTITVLVVFVVELVLKGD